MNRLLRILDVVLITASMAFLAGLTLLASMESFGRW